MIGIKDLEHISKYLKIDEPKHGQRVLFPVNHLSLIVNLQTPNATYFRNEIEFTYDARKDDWIISRVVTGGRDVSLPIDK